MVAALANRYDSPLLSRTLDSILEAVGGLLGEASVYLDRGLRLERHPPVSEGWWLGLEISKGKPAPLEAGLRWVSRLN